MTKHVVYLSGRINGCTDEEASGWRERVKAELAGCYTFLDPMRVDYRGKEGQVHSHEVVNNDMTDLKACHLVLAMCETPSWGTAMEIRAAFAELRKPVVGVCSATSPSPWLRHHCAPLFRSLDEAIAFLRAVHAAPPQTGYPDAGEAA